MFINIQFFISALLFLSLTLQSFSQNEDENTIAAIDKLEAIADSIYGTDDELVNGQVYYQKNLFAAGSPFFISEEWLAGQIKVNGQTHENVFLKYNLDTGEVILKAVLNNGSISAIVLNTSFVESFTISDHLFIEVNEKQKQIVGTDFVELIYKGDFSLISSNQKMFIRDYNNKTPHGKYSGMNRKFFILQGDKLERIGSVSALMKYFEPNKKEIKRYTKKSSFKYNKAENEDWIKLMEYCDGLKLETSK